MSKVATPTAYVVYCPTHKHYLVRASAGGTTWTDSQDGAARYAKRAAVAAAKLATWLDHRPVAWAVAAVRAEL